MESHCTAVHLSVMLNSEVTFLLFLLFFFFHSSFSIFLACSFVSSYRLCFISSYNDTNSMIEDATHSYSKMLILEVQL